MVVPNDRVNDDRHDEIIEEIRAVRRAHAAALGFDVARIGSLHLLISSLDDGIVVWQRGMS